MDLHMHVHPCACPHNKRTWCTGHTFRSRWMTCFWWQYCTADTICDKETTRAKKTSQIIVNETRASAVQLNIISMQHRRSLKVNDNLECRGDSEHYATASLQNSMQAILACHPALCTEWLSIHTMTLYAQNDSLFTQWRSMHRMTLYAQNDSLCTEWLSMHRMTLYAQNDHDSLCTEWLSMHRMTLYAQNDSLCTQWLSMHRMTGWVAILCALSHVHTGPICMHTV